MKRQIGFWVLFLLSFAGISQSLGEIVVDSEHTATLIFDQDIDFAYLGSSPRTGEASFQGFDLYVNQNVCVIRVNCPSATKTTLTVRLHDGSVHFGTATVGDTPKMVYTYSELRLPTGDSLIAHTGSTEVTTQFLSLEHPELKEIIENIKIVLSIQPEYHTLASRVGNVLISLQSFRSDGEYIFAAIKIQNESKSSFSVNDVVFRFFSERGRRTDQDMDMIVPITIVGQRFVQAGKTEAIGVAIPHFSVGNQGIVEVEVIEGCGARHAKIAVSGSVLGKMKVL